MDKKITTAGWIGFAIVALIIVVVMTASKPFAKDADSHLINGNVLPRNDAQTIGYRETVIYLDFVTACTGTDIDMLIMCDCVANEWYKNSSLEQMKREAVEYELTGQFSETLKQAVVTCM